MIKKIFTRRTLITVTATALVTATLINAHTAPAAPAAPTAGVVVLDTTGSLMTSVGMITGDLTVRADGRTVTAQYRNAADWYAAAPCPTEDSVSCVWLGRNAVVINSRTEGE